MDLHTESWGAELVVLAQLSWPVMSTNLLAFTMQITSQIFLGHRGPESLAAAALGGSFFNMMWYFLQGASTALDTLASQAFGAGDTALVRLWAWRCALLLSGLCVPVSAVMWCSGEVMAGLFWLPRDLSMQAGAFVRWSIPGTWFWAWYLCVQKYQQSQNVMLPSVFVTLAANVVNVAATYVMMDVLGLGFVGAPAATSLARLAMLLCLALHARCTPAPPPPASAALPPVHDHRRVIERASLALLLQMGLAGGAMMGLESWGFEAMTVAAGRVGDVALDAHNILLAAAGFSFMSFPLGISVAATIRVGNLIGAGEGVRARRAATLSVSLGAGFMLATGLIMFLFRTELARIFSDSTRVVALTARLTPIASLFAVVDGIQGVCGGIWRGLGRQALIARMNLFSFWLVGVPVGWALCFSGGLGVFGLWWGLFAGLGSVTAIYAFLWARVDWQWEAAQAALTAKLLRAEAGGSQT